MAKLFLRVLLAFLGLIALLAIVGFFLPRDFRVEVSDVIAAPREVVFAQLNDLRKWEGWSSWNQTDVPGLKIEYGPETVGAGATQRWTEARGGGKIWITASDPPQALDYRLEFGGFQDLENQIRLAESETGTRVTWTSTGSLPRGPFYGYFGFLFESGMEYEYQKSLDRLKEVVESSNRK